MFSVRKKLSLNFFLSLSAPLYPVKWSCRSDMNLHFAYYAYPSRQENAAAVCFFPLTDVLKLLLKVVLCGVGKLIWFHFLVWAFKKKADSSKRKQINNALLWDGFGKDKDNAFSTSRQGNQLNWMNGKMANIWFNLFNTTLFLQLVLINGIFIHS